MTHRWYGQPGVLAALRPLASLYGAVVERRRQAAAPAELPVPVVVVGNITVGGTGKTPLLMALIAALRECGRTPGVIARGYGGGARAPMLVKPNTPVAVAGDEPLLIAQATAAPVCIGRDRVAAARHLLANAKVDVLLSDDGLQHYRLPRAFEICVIDGARGLGNGCLLPVGPLREPISRLADVDAVVINGYGFHYHGALRFELVPSLFVNVATGARRELGQVDISRASACAGIGNPQRFFNTLRSLGFVGDTRAFADHHAFTAAELAAYQDRTLVMTAKDAVKCRSFAGPDWWALEVTAELPVALIERLEASLPPVEPL